MTENKPYRLRAGYYHNYTGICKNKEENFTTNEVVDKLNEQGKRIEHLNRKIERERRATQKQHEKWDKQATEKIKELEEENEQLKSDNKELQMRYDAQRELYCQLDCVKNNLYVENKDLKQEIQNVYDLIDKKTEQCVLFNDTKSAVVLSDLKKEIKGISDD